MQNSGNKILGTQYLIQNLIKSVGWDEARTPTTPCVKCWGSCLTPTYGLSSRPEGVILSYRGIRFLPLVEMTVAS